MFRTKTTFVRYDVFQITSYGNGAAYALDYIEPDGSVTEVAFFQDECDIIAFEEWFDGDNTREDYAAFWTDVFYGQHGDKDFYVASVEG